MIEAIEFRRIAVKRTRSLSIRGNVARAPLIFCILACAAVAIADESPLFQQQPYDTIKLDDENKGVLLKVQPLALPNRRVPANPNPSTELEVHLLDRPKKAYQLTWEHIVEVKLFERRVLDEAEALVAAGKYDEAYPYYEFLERRYPELADLPASYEKYLLASAGAAYKLERYEESLALLWELFARDPQRKAVAPAIQRVAGKLFDRWLREQDFVAARGMLRELSARLKDQAEPLATDGNARLQQAAAERLAKAKQDVAAGKYAEARRAAQQSLAAWPEIAGAAALAAEMQTKYPVVEVGVAATAEESDWARRRTTRLLTRSIAELTQLNGETAAYATPLVNSIDSSGQRVTFALKPGIHWPGGSRVAPADLARAILLASDSSTSPDGLFWGKLVSGVTLPAPGQVEVDLNHPMQDARSWLDLPLWRDGPERGEAHRLGVGPYAIASEAAQETHYTAIDDYFAATKTEPREIIERLYPSTDAALAALRRGDVQVVDRLGPFEAASLADSPGVAVEPYGVPTVHLLVFNRRRPLCSKMVFRRAVAHALDRQGMLADVVLHGASAAGAQVVNTVGLRPAGDAASRPDDAASPPGLRYDPAAANVLVQVALAEAEPRPAGAGLLRSAAPAALLTLEYPADELSRRACAAIQRQLHAVGLTVKLREQSPPGSAAANASDDADLTYVEWQPLAPAATAGRLFSLMKPSDDQTIFRLLMNVATNSGADQARFGRYAEDVVRDEAAAVPLWQLTESIAYRRELHGIGSSPITLYQNVEQWHFGGDEK